MEGGKKKKAMGREDGLVEGYLGGGGGSKIQRRKVELPTEERGLLQGSASDRHSDGGSGIHRCTHYTHLTQRHTLQ